MGIEKRRGTNHCYYYHSVRVKGKVRKWYIGQLSNPAVRMFYHWQRLERAERVAALKEVRQEQEAYNALEADLERLAERRTAR